MPPPSFFLILLSAIVIVPVPTSGFTPQHININCQSCTSLRPSTIGLSARPQVDYDDDVEFFDLDDDEDDEDDYYDTLNSSDNIPTYNGIIPNPLLDAMDPDGVYERLGPELFSDWTFWRDAVLFCVFIALFTKDTHHYGTFDEVIEGLERLPSDFSPVDFLGKR